MLDSYVLTQNLKLWVMKAKGIFGLCLFLWSIGAIAQYEFISTPEFSYVGEHKVLVSAQNERYDIIQVAHETLHHIVVRKSSASGVVEKSFTGGEYTHIIELQDAVLDSDGSLYMLLVFSFYQFEVLKMDENLNPVWMRKVEEFAVSGTYFKNKIMLSNDNNVLVSLSLYDKHLALKLDKLGNIIWKNQYNQFACDKCPGFDMIPFEDGALMSLKMGSNATIYRIDAAGEVLWSKTIADGIYRHPRSIFVVNNLIYLFCIGDNSEAQMFVLNFEGELVDGFYYGSGNGYYYGVHHYMDHFYFQHAIIFSNEDVINSIIVLNENLTTTAAYLAKDLYFQDMTSGVDVNRTGGNILFASDYNTGYSFSLTDMAVNDCLQPYEASDIFVTIPHLENIASSIESGLVLKTSLPLTSNLLQPYAVVNSSMLSSSIGCIEQSELSTETFSEEIKLFPNPAQDLLYVSNHEILAKIVVLDFLGRVVKTIETPTNEININALVSGNHILQLHYKNGSLRSEKITILR
jgi:hypothetical protein